MSSAIIIKDIEQESDLIRQRIMIAAILIAILLCLLVTKLIVLQVGRHQHFTTLSQHNRVKILPIQPSRGIIYSADGVVLAENQPSFDLEITPENVKDINTLITQLGRLLPITQNNIKKFRTLLKESKRYQKIPLLTDLSEEQVAIFAVNQHNYPGVSVAASLRRYYPLEGVLAHTHGYTARMDATDLKNIDKGNYHGATYIGKLGIEKAYETQLRGRIGYQQVEVNAEGRIIRVLERNPPIKGQDLYLTLNSTLQRAATAELKGRRGAIVAIEPQTGNLLAIASAPTYNPNLFVNGIDYTAYQKLLKSDAKPLINRAIQGEYPPGSTLKPFLGFIALESGLRADTDEVWCPGWFSLPGKNHLYRDWKKAGHGHINLKQAISQSCDVYFYTLAHDLGLQQIKEGLSQFGFGQVSGIDIEGESDGLLPSTDWKKNTLQAPWYPGDTLILGIGQGYILTTPMQLVRATAALANGGILVQPRLVAAITKSARQEEKISLLTLPHNIPAQNPDHWKKIILAMQDVVHGELGTARASGYGAAHAFAGKTGTAQVKSVAQNEKYNEQDIAEQLRDHALFIGFAPVDAPKIALVVIIENGGSGSKIAAPIARRLIDLYLSQRS